MTDAGVASIFVNAALINNFVLAYFLGICPFLGVSGQLANSARMGAAVTFVMLISSLLAFLINQLLIAVDAPYLQLIAYIVIIAGTVQLVEMFVRKASPTLFRALGIFLPLITTNCAILAVALFQTNRGYTLIQCLSFALGAGAGFTLALVIMGGLREQLQLSNVPGLARGTGIVLIVAGILSLAFMGFAGLG